eukprot:gene12368-14128_t
MAEQENQPRRGQTETAHREGVAHCQLVAASTRAQSGARKIERICADKATPYGIFDFGCYGFFRDCTYNFCVEMPQSVAEGTSALPPLSRWEYCTMASENKLRSPACRYDSLLFHQSNMLMGYDICEEQFNEGVYVFEDRFDYWRNSSVPSSTLEKSAKWSTVYNGFVGDYCGAVSLQNAMIFRGEQFRYAETIDLNLISGGRVE